MYCVHLPIQPKTENTDASQNKFAGALADRLTDRESGGGGRGMICKKDGGAFKKRDHIERGEIENSRERNRQMNAQKGGRETERREMYPTCSL